MRIRIIYRNYKPIHSVYRSLETNPPSGIEYQIPAASPFLRKLYPIYFHFRDLAIIKLIIRAADTFLFSGKSTPEDDVDMFEYLQIVPNYIPTKPYVVDIEHASALCGFSDLDAKARDEALKFLGHQNCRKIIAMSQVAKNSLATVFGQEGVKLQEKTEVIFPSLINYFQKYEERADHSLVAQSSKKFKLLFVGNDIRRKGLPELLAAFRAIEREFDVSLFVVSDAPSVLRKQYKSANIFFFDPRFSADEIITKFYLCCDLFVMPTHLDTFGMAYLDALSCGLPVLATKQFAIPEMIEEGRNGWFVESRRLLLEEGRLPGSTIEKRYFAEPEQFLIENLVEKFREILPNWETNQYIRAQISSDFDPGAKFSVEVRNEKLKLAYQGK